VAMASGAVRNAVVERVGLRDGPATCAAVSAYTTRAPVAARRSHRSASPTGGSAPLDPAREATSRTAGAPGAPTAAWVRRGWRGRRCIAAFPVGEGSTAVLAPPVG